MELSIYGSTGFIGSSFSGDFYSLKSILELVVVDCKQYI